MPAITRAKAVKYHQNQRNAAHSHHKTPTKARLREAIATLQETGVYDGAHTKIAVFRRLGVSKSRGYAILSENRDSDRTFPSTRPSQTSARIPWCSSHYSSRKGCRNGPDPTSSKERRKGNDLVNLSLGSGGRYPP